MCAVRHHSLVDLDQPHCRDHHDDEGQFEISRANYTRAVGRLTRPRERPVLPATGEEALTLAACSNPTVISAGFSATGDLNRAISAATDDRPQRTREASLRRHTDDAHALGPYRLRGFLENPEPGPLYGPRRFNSSAG